MSKRASKGRVKNPCRICNQTVANKSGVQCKGACARWAHYKCLGYSPQKILDIRDGVIKITCPCPNCNPKVPVEEVVKPGRTIREFFPDQLPRGDVPCPSNAPCKQSPRQSPRVSPRQSPLRQLSPSDLKNLPPCPGPPWKASPIPKQSPRNTTGKISPSPVDRPCQPAPQSISPRQLPQREQTASQPGELGSPCQPTEEASKFQKTSPKRSCIKPKDDFAFDPTSFQPQLFQPSSFKPDPPPCTLDTCDPLCVPPLQVPPPCDSVKCRAPSPKFQPVLRNPSPPRCPPSPPDIPEKHYKDCKTPPLSRTPSEISLVSPRVSPKQSKEACPISCKTPSPPASPQKSPSASPRTTPCPTSCKNATSPDTSISSKKSLTKKDQRNNSISPTISLTKGPHNCPASPTISFSNRPPCRKTAPCQAPPPDTSLSCCKKCKNCKCSSNLSLLKTNCPSPKCPKTVLGKVPPKAPPPSLKSAPCALKTTKLCIDCTSSICPQQGTKTPPGTTCSEKKSCVNCTSSICPNQYGPPSRRSVETCTEKKSKSCACLTILRESNMRSSVSDSRMTNTCQTMLFSAINQLCTTVGQLSGQIKMLMSRMKVNG